jgi:hypothetical protein
VAGIQCFLNHTAIAGLEFVAWTPAQTIGHLRRILSPESIELKVCDVTIGLAKTDQVILSGPDSREMGREEWFIRVRFPNGTYPAQR